MKKCDLFNRNIEDKRELSKEHRTELEIHNLEYCSVCVSILGSKTKFGDKKELSPIPLKTSYYYIPGFEYSKERKCFVRR